MSKSWKILYTNNVKKQLEKLRLTSSQATKRKFYRLLKILERDPYQPPFEKLTGNLRNAFSRRLNDKDRLVYEIYSEKKIVSIITLLGHYGD